MLAHIIYASTSPLFPRRERISVPSQSNLIGVNSEEQCPVKDWCVCQWAFATYIEKAGGCDAIQDINCEATNMEALSAYKKKQGDDQNVANALKCLEQRCKLDADFDIAIAR